MESGGSAGLERQASRSTIAWLTVILVIALGLRLPRLIESLWYDEIASYILYAAKGPWYVLSNYHDPSNHIFHSLLAWASVTWFAWLGSIEFAFRLPALFASLCLVPVVRELAREVANERTGWIAAGLAAILPVCVLEGADARGYSLMMLFSAASTWALLRGLREPKLTVWVAYAIFCALGVWSHLMTASVPVGHGVLLVALALRPQWRRRALTGLAALAGGAALTLLLHAPVLGQLVDFYLVERAITATSADQPSLAGPEGLHALLQLGGSWFWWAAIPGLLLVAIGIVRALGDARKRLALAARMLGLVIMTNLVAALGLWMYARFALFSIPGAILLMAFAIDWLWMKNRVIAMAAFGVIATMSALDLFTRPPRQPLRAAVEFVMIAQDDASPVVALGLNVPDISIYEPEEFEIVFTTHAGFEFEQLIASSQVRHIIIAYPHLLTPSRTRAVEENGFSRATALPGWADWGRGEIWVYQRVR